MATREAVWSTEKEISFLNELASGNSLEFGTSRHGRNRIVDCQRALAGYAAALESRTNWHKLDQDVIRTWLREHSVGRVDQAPSPDHQPTLTEAAETREIESGADAVEYSSNMHSENIAPGEYRETVLFGCNEFREAESRMDGQNAAAQALDSPVQTITASNPDIGDGVSPA